jgi:hypothetical protein
MSTFLIILASIGATIIALIAIIVWLIWKNMKHPRIGP